MTPPALGEGVDEELDGEDSFPLSPLSQLFQFKLKDEDSEVVIYAVLTLAHSLDVVEFVSLFNQKVIPLTRFHSKIVRHDNGKYDWVPVKVNIFDHIHIVSLPSADRHKGTDSAVEFGRHLMNLPLNSEIPPWEVHVLQSNSIEVGDKVVFRLHHSLGDGISMASLFLDVVETSQSTVPTLPAPRKRQSNNTLYQKAKTTLSYTGNTLISMLRIASILLSKDPIVGVKVPKSVRHKPRDVCSLNIPLEDLRGTGKALEATVNDVFVTLIAAAMDKLVKSQVKENGKVSKSCWPEIDGLPKYRPHGIVVVNLRPPLTRSEIEHMRVTGKKDPKWGTVAGYVVARMPVNRVKGSLDRLKLVQQELDRAKHSAEASMSNSAMNVIGLLFGPRVLLAILTYIANQSTCTISNVAGPTEEVLLGGNPVKSMYQFASGLPNGAAFHLLGYADSAFLCITTDAATVSAELLCTYFSQSLEELKLVVNANGK